MSHRSGEGEGRIAVLLGRRLSRRAFLQAMAAAGIAATGVGATAAGVVRPADPRAPQAPRQSRGSRVDDLAAELFYDVDEIFAFVRDAIRYEPYVGVLRGPEGTLASRAGNSADQAALLAALLDASLIPYRFAFGPIDPATAEAVATSGHLGAADARTALESAFAGSRGSTSAPAPDAQTQALLDQASDRAEDVTAWAEDQLRKTVSTITSALRAEGIDLHGGFSAVPAREIEEHVWVQAAQGAGWLDLDPTIPTNSPGTGLSGAASTAEVLGDDLYHRVELAVLGEQAAGGSVTTTELMRISARADDLAGLPITFLNADPSGVEQLAEAITPMAGVTSYRPTLVVGDEVFAGDAIAFGRAGTLESDDLFDGGSLLDGGGPSETTAEWLELTILSPDRDPVVTRRAIFDRFGPAARAAGELDPGDLAPVAELEMLDGRPGILPAQASTWLTVSVGTPDGSAPILDQTEEDTGALGVFAHGLHLFRELGDVFVAAPLGVRSFFDAPNVAAYTIRPRTRPDGQDLVEAALDIVHRSRGTVPVLDTEQQVPAAMAAGVLDHVIERLMAGDALDRATDSDVMPMLGVGAVFDAAEREGVPVRVVRDASDVAALDYPADARAALAASLIDGWVAVAPERPVSVGAEERAGWWLIDPARGLAVDALDDGRGAVAERIALDATVMSTQTAFRRLAYTCIAGTAAAFAALIFLAIGIYAVADDSALGALLEGGAATGAGGVGGYLLHACLTGSPL